jgi:4-hydroxy-tetrahydrodipicolinate synthase
MPAALSRRRKYMTDLKKFRGVVPPLVTPVTPGGSLDEPAVGRIIDHLVAGGVDGVFILGTTGESASVPMEMRRRFARVAAGHLRGRALLYVGIGDNCFANSVAAAADAFGHGADAVVAQLPSYYPLKPDEMFAYYSSLADRLEGPLLLYNIPITTHMSIPVDVVVRLASHPRIVGFKDSENNADRMDEIAGRLLGREAFSLFVGVGVLSARGLLMGLDGVVPSSGNVEPRSWRAMCDAAGRGDRAGVERLQIEVNRLAQVFQRDRTLGQSLAALKAAMSILGLCGNLMLPPLQPVSSEAVDAIRTELTDLGLCPSASCQADDSN